MEVREGLEAEKVASQREQRSFTAVGSPESERRRKGSRWAQYQAPLPFIAFDRIVISLSYLFLAAIAAAASVAGGLAADGAASIGFFYLLGFGFWTNRWRVEKLGFRLCPYEGKRKKKKKKRKYYFLMMIWGLRGGKREGFLLL